MLWLRGVVFSILVPGTVGVLVPQWLRQGREAAPGWWQLGWLLLAGAILMYLRCLLSFLASGGTPAIFFVRPLRFVLGEEPHVLVKGGLYRISRNPMYLAVFTTIIAQAVVYRAANIAIYAAAVMAFFHLVVVFIEEPHLARERGLEYEQYCRRVPRWLGWPRA
jgi:protein-S-isoprenylcysteine O-methyltransferase Ste14